MRRATTDQPASASMTSWFHGPRHPSGHSEEASQSRLQRSPEGGSGLFRERVTVGRNLLAGSDEQLLKLVGQSPVLTLLPGTFPQVDMLLVGEYVEERGSSAERAELRAVPIEDLPQGSL